MKYLLALDQGTTSSRAIVFDTEGGIRSLAQQEFAQYFPAPDRVEHNPAELLESQRAVAVEAIRKAGLKPSDIAGLGITNQRETTVFWDRRTGEPLGNAIVWQDRRTAGFCRRLKSDGLEQLIGEKTGLLIDPYFSGTKLRWMLDHIPGARERAERGELAFGTVDSWLIWNLTAERRHVTDASNASRTMLFNLQTGDWDDELPELLKIPRTVLPEITDSSGIIAETAPDSGFGGIPIAGIAGDQQSALFGQACLSPGMAKNTYGTGCFLLLHTGTERAVSRNRLLSTVAWRIGGKLEYALEGSVFTGGAVVQWLRDGLGLIESAAEIETLAAQVPDSGGAVLVPAFSGLGAPHWDPYARGTICGLTRGTTAAHLARAALEAIGLQSLDLLEAMRLDSGLPLRELRADGGASVNNLLMQIQADLLQAPVVRPRITETTAFGAACLAGLATGCLPDRAAVASHWHAERVFEPQADPGTVKDLIGRWNDAIGKTKTPST